MDREKQIENFRVLWEQIMINRKLEICTEELKDSGLLDINILRLLYNSPEIIPKEIAAKLNIPNSTLTNVINRLEKKGFLERKLNSKDLRSLRLTLTDKGKQAILNHYNKEKIMIENIFNVLGEKDSNSLIKILEKIAEHL